ncbi:acyltransferase family protein [Engelhardtia mirabilis]|uniref:O-acetyltransferase OatA n=1 Tax=Engelhardtia mirabilis TaxID=2528011 RepID=A0A518BMQ9_9BACT|nr:O-acetyltransferase OatA [Planctomycetes bacterium Pla133]QDV02598.1 O-acetyltransferase OatA [Planctomycetes bacterium Pla86]
MPAPPAPGHAVVSTPTRRPGLIPELDGLRAIAVLIVLWEHSPRGVTDGLVPGADHLGRWLLGPGYLGVDLFFVLSGFLITRILLADRALGTPLRQFWIRRFLRIFPIYYLLLALVWIFAPGPELPWCAAYLANFYQALHFSDGPLLHTWSLSVEEHFYLVWPLAAYWLSPRWSRRSIAWLVLPGALLAAVLLTMDAASAAPLFKGPAIQKLTFTRAFSLGAGCLLAYAEPWLCRERWKASGMALVLVAFSILSGVPALVILWNHKFLPYTGVAIPMSFAPALNLVSFAALSTAAVVTGISWRGSRAPWAWLLRRATLRGVGRISYGLYLYHFPIYDALNVLYPPSAEVPGPPLLPRTLLAIGLTFAAATASYFAIERPLLRIGARFRGTRTEH